MIFRSVILPETLTEDLKNALPEILRLLNEKYIPRWENIKDHFVLYKIEEFCNELNQLAMNYQFRFLMDYAGKMNRQVESVHLESIKEMLKEFPQIITKIASLSKE